MDRKILLALISLALLVLTACSAAPDAAATRPQVDAPTIQSTSNAPGQEHALEPTYAAMIAAERDPNIPDLPFADNPDPNQCGIPTQWGLDDPGWLTGIYEGEVVQPTVLLYDSHLRLKINGRAPHGSEVTIKLFQQNPVTDYYLVEVRGAGEPTSGWVPAPFLSFEPVAPLNES